MDRGEASILVSKLQMKLFSGPIPAMDLSDTRPPDAAEGLGRGFTLDRRASVADQVYAAVREAILRVQLAPGAAISENALCRQFGVSRTPVRAAIQKLSEEGLVDVYPQHGSFVAPIRIAGLQDSHFIRRALEVALLREAAARWTPAMTASLRQALAEQAAFRASGDLDAFLDADERFHRLFATHAGRESVWPAILSAKARLTRFIRMSGNPQRLSDVLAEHAAVIDALERGDVPAAEAALVSHLDQIFLLLDRMPLEERRHFEP